MDIAVGDHCFRVSAAPGTPRSAHVSVSVDDTVEHVFEVAGWRPWACGVARGELYVWTARQVITFPPPPSAPIVTTVDEDVLRVWRIVAGWVLVCETSIRLLGEGGADHRVELADVVERARWERDVLVVEDVAGVTRSFVVGASGIDDTRRDHWA